MLVVCVQVVYVSDDVGADSGLVPASVPFLSPPKPAGANAPHYTTDTAAAADSWRVLTSCPCACVSGSGGGGGQVSSCGVGRASGPRHVALPAVGRASQ